MLHSMLALIRDAEQYPALLYSNGLECRHALKEMGYIEGVIVLDTQPYYTYKLTEMGEMTLDPICFISRKIKEQRERREYHHRKISAVAQTRWWVSGTHHPPIGREKRRG